MRTLFTVPGKQVVRSRCAWRSISTCQSRSSSSWNQRPLELSRRQKWGCQPSSSPLCCSERSRAEWARCNRDRKSTRLNSSHDQISYAVFCLKKKKTKLEVPHDGTTISVIVVRSHAVLKRYDLDRDGTPRANLDATCHTRDAKDGRRAHSTES